MIEGKGRFAAALETENLLPYLPGGVKLRQSFPHKPAMYKRDRELVPSIGVAPSAACRCMLLLACSSAPAYGRPILLGILSEEQLLMRPLRVPNTLPLRQSPCDAGFHT